ncbi:hypothetical protein [Marinicella rhabdoformis]|uniref:hypothetical protein n=1 Tax=Marinicella rhabdoformis TaxID=2580566 RepID=UPI0015CFD43D|nr:hypothetical protein [Marinicella rhabdoformis]
MKTFIFIFITTASMIASAQTALQDMQDSEFLPESNPDHQFDYQEVKKQTFTDFESAAKWADVVAIAQLTNIDYTKQRALNAEGQAYLTVRVGYKGVQKNELLIINAKGFEKEACYFPDKEGVEGQRYLVFLKATASDGEYTGFKPLCQLPILLTDTGQYALKYPLDTEIPVPDTLVKNLSYKDPHATIDTSEWTHLKREEIAESQFMELTEKDDLFQKRFFLSYTKGIMMYEIRKLMNIPIQPRITSKQK